MKNNCKYKVDDTEIILSSEEHELVKKAFEAGKSPVFLRGGSLAINKSFVRYVRETEQLTAIEEENRQQFLALPPQDRPKPTYLPKNEIRGGGLKKVFPDNDHKACVNCQEVHFIPDNKTLCLPCLNK